MLTAPHGWSITMRNMFKKITNALTWRQFGHIEDFLNKAMDYKDLKSRYEMIMLLGMQ
jgi:hypothetical protein